MEHVPQLSLLPTSSSSIITFSSGSACDASSSSDDRESSHKKRRASPSAHQPLSSVVKSEGEEVGEDEAWRPTADEYQRLSSKEKRQLRNKASARNFRIRRKEQVSTLESQVGDRDKLIEAIRSELGQEKLENAALR